MAKQKKHKKTERLKGIHHAMTEEQYIAVDAVNISSLKYISRSPAHYRARLQDQRPTSQAQLVGSMLHAMVAGEKQAGWVVRPESLKFTSKEGREWRDAQTLPILSEEENCSVLSMYDALMSNELVSSLFEDAQHEVSAFKIHNKTGIFMKGRLDVLRPNQDLAGLEIADIKTTDDASPGEFVRSVRKWQYHRQAAYYMDLVGAVRFVFIAVEKAPPYSVAIYELDERSIEAGRYANEKDLERLSLCIKSDKWPSYSESVMKIGII